MDKSRQGEGEQGQRLNIQLSTPIERESFRRLKLLAAATGERVKYIVLRSINRTVDEELPSLLKKEQK